MPKKIELDIDEPLSQKLEKLYEAEIKYEKSVAKKHGIVYPKLPLGINKEQINEYYNLKIDNKLEIQFVYHWIKKLFWAYLH